MTKKNLTVQKTPLTLEDDELPIVWVSEFNMETVQEFTKKILRLDSDPEVKDIFIYISSFGGGAYALLAMIEIMQSCTTPIHTVCLGLSASAGGVLLACGTGQRWIAPNSFLHIHRLQTGAIGDLPSVENDVKHSKVLEEKIFNLLVEKSKVTREQLNKKLNENEKEWHLTAKQAKKLGFADNIGVPVFKKYIMVEYK